MTETMTPPKLAKLWGVTPEKVINWIRSGELPAFNAAENPAGRPRYRISREDMETFKARRSVAKRRQIPKPRPLPPPAEEFV